MRDTEHTESFEEVLLVDNGSLRADAARGLRALAGAVGERIGRRVEPVSLLHSDKVDPARLDGRPAVILEHHLAARAACGVRRFLVLPLFLGPSRAVTEYVPELEMRARERWPDLSLASAGVLAGPDPRAPDPLLAEMAADAVRTVLERTGLARPAVALVDHGSPVEEVAQLRNAVAAHLRERLGGAARAVAACSMERRPGPEYAFNEPLLEAVDAAPGMGGGGALVVAMFFLLPGRHAGENGDVAEICGGLRARGAFDRIERTGLLGEDPRLVDLLAGRYREALRNSRRPAPRSG